MNKSHRNLMAPTGKYRPERGAHFSQSSSLITTGTPASVYSFVAPRRNSDGCAMPCAMPAAPTSHSAAELVAFDPVVGRTFASEPEPKRHSFALLHRRLHPRPSCAPAHSLARSPPPLCSSVSVRAGMVFMKVASFCSARSDRRLLICRRKSSTSASGGGVSGGSTSGTKGCCDILPSASCTAHGVVHYIPFTPPVPQCLGSYSGFTNTVVYPINQLLSYFKT
jgi:hypothetical protein